MNQPFTALGASRDVLGRRVLAFGLDLVVVSVPVAALVTASGASGTLAAVSFAVAALGYFASLEGRFGQTVGKRLLGIVVVGADGRRCTARSAAVRTLGRLVDVVPVVYLLPGAAAYHADRDRQRVGDVLADTFVVAAVPPVALESTETPAVRTT